MRGQTLHRQPGVAWRTANLLTCVAMASVVMVAIVIAQVSSGADAVLELGDGQARVSEAHASNTVRTAQGSARSNPGLLVRDKDGVVWTSATAEVEVLHLSYAGSDGDSPTVLTADKEKLVAPGTTGSYDFDVTNTADCQLTYVLVAKVTTEPRDVAIPLEGRLRRGDTWLFGDQNTWMDLRSLNVRTEVATLAAHRTDGYRLEWRWPYEREEGDGLSANDAYDTHLGNLQAAGAKDITVTVNLGATASFDEAASTQTDRGAMGRGATPETGDTRHDVAIAWVGAVGVVALLLGGVLQRSREVAR